MYNPNKIGILLWPKSCPEDNCIELLDTQHNKISGYLKIRSTEHDEAM